MESKLLDLAYGGHHAALPSVLQSHPEINVNSTNHNDFTALHWACCCGHVEVVKLLLAHSGINVNPQTNTGATPFYYGCSNGDVTVVQLLLKDPRLDVTLADNCDCSPFALAAQEGQYAVIEWLMASGRDLGDLNLKGEFYQHERHTALEIAREERNTEVVLLLERFMRDPALTRHELRVRLGMLDELAAEIFALTVFLCDGLLQLKPASHPTAFAAAVRFFSMVSKLPLELQMVLCHRAVGSMKQNILHQDSEAALKDLARILLAP